MFEERMGRLDVLYLFYLVAMATGVYIPEELTSSQQPDPVPPTCPHHCQCTDINLPIQCVMEHTDLTLTDVLPWKLGHLKLTDDQGGSKSGRQYSNIRDLLHRDISTADAIAVFEYLTVLDISYIPIQQIASDDLHLMTNLYELTLWYNNISLISPGAFDTLHRLQVLNFDGNIIEVLPEGIFSNLSMLKKVSLSGNRFRSLDARTFSGLHSLSELFLINNNLLQIEHLLDNVTSLDVFDVRDNQLKFIGESTVEKMEKIDIVKVGQNLFECTCVMNSLIAAVQKYPDKFPGPLTCSEPENKTVWKLSELEMGSLPCLQPNVNTSAGEVVAQNREDFVQSCVVEGTEPVVVYWLTHWGQKYAHPSVMDLFPSELAGAASEWRQFDVNLHLTTHVYVTEDGSLHIDNFRPYFSGNLTCVAVSMLGEANSTVTVESFTEIKHLYLFSLIIGSGCAGGMLIIAIIIGMIRMFVNKCLHEDKCNCCCCRCDDVNDKCKPYYYAPKEVEIIYAVSSSTGCGGDTTDFDPDEPPPDPPVNSPIERSSPEKCETPGEETTPNMSPHIWEQLDEVRSRLRYGAERKIEKVRSHVKNITDTGTLKIRNMKEVGTIKIQSMKETSSHAALRVKKNVAGGMLQVKYGVQSIKEFCGTGEMGPGTVSMMSVSTDIDRNESTHMVKSHTFV